MQVLKLVLINSLGTENYWKEVNSEVWLNAMLNESEPPGQFYSDNFKQWADIVLQELSMLQEFLSGDIYLYLINHPDNFRHSDSTS